MQYAASQIVIQHILAKFDKMGERVIMMGLGARKLKDMVGKILNFGTSMIFSPQDFFGKSDPFLVIGCPNPHTGTFETVRTTETKDVGRHLVDNTVTFILFVRTL